MTSTELRAHTRYDIDHEVEVTRADLTVEGRMANLSRGGTLVSAEFHPPLAMGERVGVSFRVPDLEAPISCQAEVRWINGVDRRVVGLQFVTGMRARETWALGRFLERVRDGELQQ
jgi:hypothetical protein